MFENVTFTTNFIIIHKKLEVNSGHDEINVNLGTQNTAKMLNLADTAILYFFMGESISKIYFSPNFLPKIMKKISGKGRI